MEYDIVAKKVQPAIDPITGKLVDRNPAQESAPKPGGSPTPEPVPPPQPTPTPPQPEPVQPPQQ